MLGSELLKFIQMTSRNMTLCTKTFADWTKYSNCYYFYISIGIHTDLIQKFKTIIRVALKQNLDFKLAFVMYISNYRNDKLQSKSTFNIRDWSS